MIVIDASAMIELLLVTEAALGVQERIFRHSETLHAPHLLDLEVSQVLRRYCLAGDMDAERGEEALADLLILGVNRYPHDLFLPRIWELRHNVTAYDAAYIALAEELSAPLLTRDQRLATAPGHTAVVEVF